MKPFLLYIVVFFVIESLCVNLKDFEDNAEALKTMTRREFDDHFRNFAYNNPIILLEYSGVFSFCKVFQTVKNAHNEKWINIKKVCRMHSNSCFYYAYIYYIIKPYSDEEIKFQPKKCSYGCTIDENKNQCVGDTRR